jgi:hypothetical protein
MIDDQHLERWTDLARHLVIPEESLFLRVVCMLAMEHERESCAAIARDNGADQVAEMILARGQQ